MNSTDLAVFEQSFLKYSALWRGIECSNDQEILEFARSLRGNMLINHGPEMVYLLEYQKQRYLYFSSNISSILGITIDSIKIRGIKAILSLFHPNDLRSHLSFTLPRFSKYIINVAGHELMNTKFAFNYRLQRSDGKYLHFLQQFIVLKKDENGIPIYEYGTISDISHITTENRIFFRVTSFTEGKGYTNKLEAIYPGQSQAILSQRELEIVALMKSGLNSKEIASKLNISSETVRTHKKNMYSKTLTRGQLELIEFVREKGLL
jgi:DNA-binding CsgD family transcriptional regulator